MGKTIDSRREAIWMAMVRQSREYGGFTRHQVARQTGASASYVRGYAAALKRAGYITVLPGEAKRDTGFKVLRSQIEAPRVRRDGTDLGEPIYATLWRTIRMLKSFDASELAHHASLPGRPVKLSTAATYAFNLEARGVLVLLDKGRRARSMSRYGIIGTPGGKAPRVACSIKPREHADGPAD